MTEVSIREARARFSEIVERAQAGADITITKNGIPQVELVPSAAAASKRRMAKRDMLAILQGGGMDPAAWDELTNIPGGTVADAIGQAGT